LRAVLSQGGADVKQHRGIHSFRGAVESSAYCFRCFVTTLVQSVRLGIFAMLLLVPFLRIGRRYFSAPRVRRGIRCGPGCRNFVDVYCPDEAVAAQDGSGTKVPVVVAIMGGAWVVGHRAWNAQLGQRLMDAGVLVMAIDYHNYPFGCVPDMIDDINLGLNWVFENVEAWGGDASNVVLTGQSAGAHLSATLLLKRSLSEAVRPEAEDLEMGGVSGNGLPIWSPSRLRGFVGISGPYDLPALGQRLEERRIGSFLLRRICPGGDLENYSPIHVLRSALWQEAGDRAARCLPPTLLFHGETDKTVPAKLSSDFADALKSAGVASVVADIRPMLAHAEVIIEGPMRGEDHQIKLLLPYLFNEAECAALLDRLPPLQPMFPRPIIRLASVVMPF